MRSRDQNLPAGTAVGVVEQTWNDYMRHPRPGISIDVPGSTVSSSPPIFILFYVDTHNFVDRVL
jgi:hypothetical protein